VTGVRIQDLATQPQPIILRSGPWQEGYMSFGREPLLCRTQHTLNAHLNAGRIG
jgi:hypothetical protein